MSLCDIVAGVYTPVLEKYSKHFSLEDSLAEDYSRQVGQHPATALAPPLDFITLSAPSI